MPKKSDKDIFKEALEKSKELEKEKLPSKKQIVKEYQEGMGKASQLQKFLKNLWFLNPEKKHKAGHKKKKLR